MIYIEQIALLDFLIHHIFYYLTCLICCSTLSKIRLILGDLLNLLCLITYFIFHYDIKIEFVFILIIGIITFEHRPFPIFIYFFLNVSLGGIANVIYNSFNYHWYYTVIIILCYLTMIFIFFKYNKRIIHRGLYYKARFKNEGVDILLFLDTGNSLVDYDNQPVIILNKKYIKYLSMSSRYIEISTINGRSKEACYKCNDLYIKINKRYVKYKGSIILKSNVFDGIIGLKAIGG